MSDEGFQLQIESHPDTHLLQTLRLDAQRSVQILRLFDKYYLLERNKGERRPPIQLEEASVIQRLKQDGRLAPNDIEALLPPAQGIDFLVDDSTVADPLASKLQQAMARFAAQNPETAQALQMPKSAPLAQSFQVRSAYESHPALGAIPQPEAQPVASQPESLIEQVAEYLPAREAPLESLTQPVVQQALRQANDNQQKLLEQAQQLKSEVERRSQRVQKDIERLPALQERFEELNQRLEQWQSEMERHHFSRDSLLESTAEELARMQRQLRQILSDGLALQKVLREHRFPNQQAMSDKLECFEDMLEHVVQQRHWVHYLQQQQAFRQLEQERLKGLQERQRQLQQQIAALKDSIQQLEQINREILNQDPLAVPEPVPALALHELARLEYELEILQADPALQLLEES